MFAYRPTISRSLAARLARPIQLAAVRQNARAYAAAAAAAATTVVTEQPTWTPSTFPVPTPVNSPTKLDASRNRNNGKQILREAIATTSVRNDWTRDEIAAIYHEPLMELVHQAVRQGSPSFPLLFALGPRLTQNFNTPFLSLNEQ